ncbi:MAG: septum formation protein Maf [Deltaproteobacteria bacterium]|nr:septum formation protein Maf [Deltaproteobacteria bacterium]
MQIILASSSSRRRDLLSLLGIPFEIKPPGIEEIPLDGETPPEFCMRASYKKAYTIAQNNKHAIIIAADTVVVIDDAILGKPKDVRQAFHFLMMLKSRVHDVFTGYTIVYMAKEKTISRVINTKVHFKDMTNKEILWYISTKEPMDKAGAYGIQGLGALFIDGIEGSYTNVIGLPLSDVYTDLKGLGIYTGSGLDI